MNTMMKRREPLMEKNHKTFHMKEYNRMRNLAVVVILIGGAVLLSSCRDERRDSAPDTTTAENSPAQLWTCGMHPEIIRNEPGDCPICGMRLTPVKQSTLANGPSAADGEKRVLYYKDPMHPWYTSDKPGKAPDCGMDLVPVYEGQQGSAGVIRIDPAVEQNMNVKIEPVGLKKLNTIIRTSGHIGVAEPGLASVNTKINGWIDSLYVDYLGQAVHRGEKLLDIYSPQLVTAQEELLTAIAYKNRVSKSRLSDVVASGDKLVDNAKRKLLLWDISDRQVEDLVRTGEVRRALTLYAPSDGVVLERNVVRGEFVTAGRMLMKIADLSTVWLHADLYEYELSRARVGQVAKMHLPYVPGREYEGRVAFIYPTLDPKARTGRVRINFPNPDLDLKPEMFANVEIETQPREGVVAVPEQAVIRTGTKDIVIIALGGGRFEPREVTLGIYSDGFFEVVRNLEAGEKIVISSQFLIDSESNLRAALNLLTAGTPDMPMDSGGTGAGGQQMPSQTHQHEE